MDDRLRKMLINALNGEHPDDHECPKCKPELFEEYQFSEEEIKEEKIADSLADKSTALRDEATNRYERIRNNIKIRHAGRDVWIDGDNFRYHLRKK